MDIISLNRRAVLASVEVIAKAIPGDLDRLTPCSGWLLSDLLAHMIAQHYGFAAAAVGDGATMSHWALQPLGDDPVGSYRASAERVVAAFASEGVLSRRFALPEISTSTTLRAERAIGFHFIDYVVHAWDVAATLAMPLELDADLLEAVLPLVEVLPNGVERLAPGAAFAPGVDPGPAVPPLHRVLALLGRDPAWAVLSR